ncbi:MAG: APC family permease [Flavobacteriaceae bacterium]
MSLSSIDNDSKELAKFGYKQDLKRSMRKFSSFAVSFSLISILTGIFANFHFGFSEVGNFIPFSWTIVFVGQFIVALIMAELSVNFPISGYGYQWTYRLVGPKLGFTTGWLLLLQFLTGFPGICKALSMLVSDLIFQNFNINISSLLISVIVIWIVTFIHLKGINLVSTINNLGVITEILGIFILITFLVYFLLKKSDLDILYNLNNLTLSDFTLKSFALSILLGAWCLTGFEAAADMSEETKNPKFTVPKSIKYSLVSSGFLGLIIILLSTVFLSTNNYQNLNNNYLTDMLQFEFGAPIYLTTLFFIIIAIFACAVACMATASRLIFSMSRDSILPKSKWLSFVDKNKSPSNSLIFIGVISTLFIMIFEKIELITSVSAISGYIGYCGIIYSSFFLKGSNSINKIPKILKSIALIWCVFVVLCLLLPGQAVEGFNFEYIHAISLFVFLIIGFFVYLNKFK